MGWDFVNDLEIGDSVAMATVTAKRLDTGADVSSAFLQGKTVESRLVHVQVQGGEDGVDYDVEFLASTADGDVFERHVKVQVRAA